MILGGIPHGAARAQALAFETVEYFGVAYLLTMAWSALHERGALRIDAAPHPLIPAKAGIQGTLRKNWFPAPRFAKAKLWLRGGESAGTSGQDARSAMKARVEAIPINILNPKLSISFCAFLPQFVQQPLVRQAASLSVQLAWHVTVGTPAGHVFLHTLCQREQNWARVSANATSAPRSSTRPVATRSFMANPHTRRD